MGVAAAAELLLGVVGDCGKKAARQKGARGVGGDLGKRASGRQHELRGAGNRTCTMTETAGGSAFRPRTKYRPKAGQAKWARRLAELQASGGLLTAPVAASDEARKFACDVVGDARVEVTSVAAAEALFMQNAGRLQMEPRLVAARERVRQRAAWKPGTERPAGELSRSRLSQRVTGGPSRRPRIGARPGGLRTRRRRRGRRRRTPATEPERRT